jgi:hypothetical protein
MGAWLKASTLRMKIMAIRVVLWMLWVSFPALLRIRFSDDPSLIANLARDFRGRESVDDGIEFFWVGKRRVGACGHPFLHLFG